MVDVEHLKLNVCDDCGHPAKLSSYFAEEDLKMTV